MFLAWNLPVSLNAILCLIICFKGRRTKLDFSFHFSFHGDGFLRPSPWGLKKSHYVLSVTYICSFQGVNFTSIRSDVLPLSQLLSAGQIVQTAIPIAWRHQWLTCARAAGFCLDASAVVATGLLGSIERKLQLASLIPVKDWRGISSVLAWTN